MKKSARSHRARSEEWVHRVGRILRWDSIAEGEILELLYIF